MTISLLDKVWGGSSRTLQGDLKGGVASAVQKGNSELNEKKPNFWKKISKLATKVIAIPVIAGTLFTGCPGYEININPEAIFEADPLSVKKGGIIKFNLDGTDGNGKDDIVDYSIQLHLDSNPSSYYFEHSSVPILDREFVFDQVGIHTAYGEVQDSMNARSIKKIIINVYNSELPIANFSEVDANLNEGETKNIELPSPTDEDTPGEIPYTKVVVNYGNVTPVLDGRNLSITAPATTKDTNYRLTLTYGTPEEGVNTSTLDGIVKNLCTISGRIESTEEVDIAKPGVVEMYNNSTNELLATVNTEDGNFEIQADSPVNSVRLEGRLNFSLPNITVIGNNFTSVWYFDGEKDYSNAYVVCVPVDSDLNNDGFSDLDTDKNGEVSETERDNFRTFARRLNFWPFVPGNGEDGLKKWNLGERTDIQKFEGVQIVYKNPASTAQFTETQRNNIENYLRTCGEQDVESIIITDDSAEKHYTIYGNTNQYVSPNKGWIVIVPALRNSLKDCSYGTTIAYDNDRDGYINKALIYIDLDHVNKTVINHEYKHGKGLVGHGNEDPRTGNSVPQIYYALMNQGTNATVMYIQEKLLDSIVRNPKYPAMKLDDEILK